jgi:hypothetical protein
VPDGPVVAPVPVFYLWPENVPAWQLWLACSTQWHHGFNGPVAANYAGWEVVMQRRRIPVRQRDRMFALLQAMERGSLTGWGEKREEHEANQPRRGA